jgi:hypothetical protein
VAYTKIFATGSFMSDCCRWNENLAADKTWTNFKTLFAATYHQHKQMQGESAANSGYNADSAAEGQTEDQMDEATIGTLANLETATIADCGVVATLTEANVRLAMQLEVKALLKKDRAERIGQRPFTPSLDNYCWSHGYKVAKSHNIQTFNFPKDGHKHEVTKANIVGGCQANKE